MKIKTVFITFVFLIAAVSLSADVFRMGATVGVDVANRPSYGSILSEFDTQANIIPGFYWEVIIGNVGFGMTYLSKFSTEMPSSDEIQYESYLDWIGTWDFRYHFFRRSFLDPFVEAGIGNAGRVQMLESEFEQNVNDTLELSMLGQIGAGLALRPAGGIHIGGRLNYRFLNSPIPATTFYPYPLKNFRFDFFGGVSF